MDVRLLNRTPVLSYKGTPYREESVYKSTLGILVGSQWLSVVTQGCFYIRLVSYNASLVRVRGRRVNGPHYSYLAQLVEQRNHNPRGAGSSPVVATILLPLPLKAARFREGNEGSQAWLLGFLRELTGSTASSIDSATCLPLTPLGESKR